MRSQIIILTFLLGFLFALTAQPIYTAQSLSLEIDTEEQCEDLGGVWNSPQCEGIVPGEDQNLSEIHNPTIGHQVKLNENNADESEIKINENNQKNFKDASQSNPPLAAKQASINKSSLILYLILGLLLLFTFIAIKIRQKNESSSAV